MAPAIGRTSRAHRGQNSLVWRPNVRPYGSRPERSRAHEALEGRQLLSWVRAPRFLGFDLLYLRFRLPGQVISALVGW